MTVCAVHTARSLENTDLWDWLEDKSLPLVTDEEQLMINQNEGMTDPRKDRKATRFQPCEKVQDRCRGLFSQCICLNKDNSWARWAEEHRWWWDDFAAESAECSEGVAFKSHHSAQSSTSIHPWKCIRQGVKTESEIVCMQEFEVMMEKKRRQILTKIYV